jgi:hypothetical protein
MREEAIAHLERLLGACEGDQAARDLNAHRAEGAIIAYERLGLLPGHEAARWRARFAESEDPGVETGGLDDARLAVERLLPDLVDRVPAMRRDPDPSGIAKATECSTAIRALHAVGVLDPAAEAAWRTRLLRAQAPWLDQRSPAPAGAADAIFVPPENEQQAAEDAARAAAWAARPKAREVHRVVVGLPLRQNDLAVVAVVVHEDATSVHFHYSGTPAPSYARLSDLLDAFNKVLEGLTPPALRDQSGRSYEPVDQSPKSAGTEGRPGPPRRQALSGSWQYTPAAPADAYAFRVQRGEAHWDLPDRH